MADEFEDLLRYLAQVQSPTVADRLPEAFLPQQPVEEDPGMNSGVTTNVPGFIAAPSSSNNFFIPEFPETAWPSGSQPMGVTAVDKLDPFSPKRVSPFAAQEEKAALLQKKWGKEGFTFEVDEKGQMVISNTPKTREAAGYVQPSEQGVQFNKELQSKISAIREATDPAQARILYEDLVQQAAQAKAAAWEGAFQQASSKLGIPRLEAMLAQNEALDKQDPLWAKFQSDSKATAAVRKQLQSLRTQVDDEAKNYLLSNPMMASLDSQMKILASTIGRHEKMAEAEDYWKMQQKYRKLEKEETEKQKLLDASSPEILQRAVIVEPSLAGKTPEVIMKNLQTMDKLGQSKEQLAAILAAPESLVDLAIAKRSPSAAKVLAAKESAITGRSLTDITGQLKYLDRTLTNDQEIMKLARQVLPLKDDYDLFARTQRTLKTGTKAEQQAAWTARVDVLTKSLVRQEENRFMGDLAAWTGYQDPELQAAITKAEQTTQKRSLEEVLAAYLGDSVGTERRLKLDQFKQNIYLAAKKPSASLLAPIDPNLMAARAEQLAIGQTLGQRLNKALPTIQSSLDKTLNPLGRAASAPRTSYQTWQDFLGD